ncbi:uncharacterized protein TRIADDRAFT_59504 [Trichoplax adhaerens]|uniref:Spondin-like TSP1 domain-containing protein n=1 Tax=Trichoplax adhaerens TaxID=10228 RepID=B3S5L3_TRIAD|nr:hypothetical protein TRIADDRAFT_59504 [Trichoplax adhaerens]EDV21976.1 hypothetical protein TRIADDRAFT_59504 [Trichoplax adhaerens]|eukprot:XP_002115613.1 hypothetical protein TRIADDRAFT_59504 [Trichoplax adhaerens]
MTLLVACTSGQFVWKTTPWQDCQFIDTWQYSRHPISPCCRLNCGQPRQVTCRRQRDQQLVPNYYCRHLSRPPNLQPCSSCSQSNACILSLWSSWSPCSTTCGQGIQSRHRQVLAVPNQQQIYHCPTTYQQQACYNSMPCNQSIQLVSSTVWKSHLGQCEDYIVDDADIQVRKGNLVCIDRNGNYIADHYCPRNLNIRTTFDELCYPKVDCLVSDWKNWSPACQGCANTSSPSSFIQKRYRRILRYPINGGQACPLLSQEQLCILPICSSKSTNNYRQIITDWGACSIDPSVQNKNSTCQNGIQRRSIICVNSDSNTIVENQFCQKNKTEIDRVSLARGCSIHCSQDCLTGQWSDWSKCSNSCGIGITSRHRKIIIPPMNAGKDCGILNQSQRCSQNNCSHWRTDAWSRCLPDQLNSQCGRGTSLRSVYCVSHDGSTLSDQNCSHLPRPSRDRSCLIPCLDDCILSEWTSWSDCHGNCSKVSKRQRYLLGTGRNCESVNHLEETRSCTDCLKDICTVSQWNACIPKPNSTCGIGTGQQMRLVNCSSLLGNHSIPANNRDCDIPCPIDCKLSSQWTTWSICSQSCGEGYSTRSKFIMQYPLHGGKPCPNNGTIDGIVLQKRLCDLPPCQNRTQYQWVTHPWSSCKLLQENSTMACGGGIQSRQVDCVYNGYTMDDHEVCINNSLLNAPDHVRSCSIPCSNDCSLSEWSAWSKCSSNCNHNADRKYRVRHFYNYNMSTGLQVCKHTVEADLKQVTNCINDQCFTYKWLIGQWHSCVLTLDNANCGKGIQKRSLLCERSDNTIVDNDVCIKYVDSIPATLKTCTIDCGLHCQMTQWSHWSDCDQECGYGIKRRKRQIIHYASGNVKRCGNLQETEVCQQRSCHGISWFTGAWSQCILNNGSSCGHGGRTRKVYCIDSNQSPIPKRLCEALIMQPVNVEPCQISCSNQCGYSMWSEWSSCSQTCSRGSRRRTRYLLRDISGLDCTDTVQAEACIVNSCHKYYWTVSPWTRCVPSSPICGQGVQFRAINCQRSDGVVVGSSLCSNNNLPTMRDCNVPCNTDCILSEWSSWSSCSASCGLNGTITRQRYILYNATGNGRPCPQHQHLLQSLPCNVKPCFNYRITRGHWSRCTTVGSECGHGKRYRTIRCIRNDGLEVDTSKCIATLIKANENKIGFNVKESTLDIGTKEDCYISCKGDCVLTTWSNYSPCHYDCNQKNGNGYRVRARQIIHQANAGGLPCPNNLVEVTRCLPSEATCAQFIWRTGKWSIQSGNREIWCVDSSTGKNVTGCNKLTMPPDNIQCQPECSNANQECRDGRCVCIVGFQRINNGCMPISGCTEDKHCAYNNSFCGTNRQCLCRDGFYRMTFPSNDNLCLPVPKNETLIRRKQDRMIRDGIIGGALAVCLLGGYLFFIRWLRKGYSMNQPVRGRKTSLWNNDVYTVRRQLANEEDDDVFFED